MCNRDNQDLNRILEILHPLMMTPELLYIHGRNKYKENQIFTDGEEIELEKTLIMSSKINFGCTYKQTRMLAYYFFLRK